MGFTVTGPDQFAASGHPATAGATNPMGLVTGSDAGRTLGPISLAGQADLHTIRSTGTGVVAYDSVTQTVVESTDTGRTFNTLAKLPGQPQALTATDGRWFAATTEGIYGSTDDGATWKVLL